MSESSSVYMAVENVEFNHKCSLEHLSIEIRQRNIKKRQTGKRENGKKYGGYEKKSQIAQAYCPSGVTTPRRSARIT